MTPCVCPASSDEVTVTICPAFSIVNIAAVTMLLHPGHIQAAALLRAMVVLEPSPAPDLAGAPVLISAGRMDPIVPAEQAETLAGMLRAAGAGVTLAWQDAGHALVSADVDAARAWLGAAAR